MKTMQILILAAAVMQLSSPTPAAPQTRSLPVAPPPSEAQTGPAGSKTAAGQTASPSLLTRSPAGGLTIGSGDLLETSIFGTDYSCGKSEGPEKTEGSCEVRVSDAGDITLPLIGRVRVSGLTVEQAEDLVARRLAAGGYYKNPQVTIVQKQYSTQGISVLGEVQKPGVYPLLGPHTVLESISAAGGTTVKAGNEVVITRRNNEVERVRLDNGSAATFRVQPGDVVQVSQAGIVYVVGDVHLPSGVVLNNSGLTVLQAIAMAQGTNPTASLDHARLIRTTANGRQELPIPLKKILSGKAEDPQLQPGDILFIPNSLAKSATRRSLDAILQTAVGVAIYRP